MQARRTKKAAKRKRRMQERQRKLRYRLEEKKWDVGDHPVLSQNEVEYEYSERTRGLDVGGIGAIHKLVQRLELAKEINRRVAVLKLHLPYRESDHVLNIAFNILSGGTCLEDLERLRNNLEYLDVLGATRIPDPTTAGDFCRRFTALDVDDLMKAINEVRLRVWAMQDESFFKEAVIEADGTPAPTTGECKAGMDYHYKGLWGYHPLLVSLANTREPLFLVNRTGSRPSHEGASARFDQAIELCKQAGFRLITLHGDTDFSQTEHLDRWNASGVRFVFGYDARANLQAIANALDDAAWCPLQRRPRYAVATKPRERPENVKQRIVKERGYKNKRLTSEYLAEFEYKPVKCQKPYRMVVLKKNLTVEKGETALFDEIVYFFYITNDFEASASDIVFESNGRCNQENLIEQLKNGVQALKMPSNTLESNWAYMVIASLAWTLKTWFGLILPKASPAGLWAEKYTAERESVIRMEFKRFINYFVRIPVQVVKAARRVVLRILSYNPFQEVFLRGMDTLEQPLLC